MPARALEIIDRLVRLLFLLDNNKQPDPGVINLYSMWEKTLDDQEQIFWQALIVSIQAAAADDSLSLAFVHAAQNYMSLEDCQFYTELREAIGWIELTKIGKDLGVANLPWDAESLARMMYAIFIRHTEREQKHGCGGRPSRLD